jgi:membrane protein implicated in regulation of membrane protease activity
MKWMLRFVLAGVLFCTAVSLGSLAAGVQLLVSLQVMWVVFGTASAMAMYAWHRENERLRRRANELSDLLTRLLTEDVDVR